MTAPGLILAAPASGSGKTVTVLALLRHFRRAGINVASRKVGPDYIDPMFHTAASGRPCINLDPWAMRPETLAALAQESADLLIVEGVMGLFDGAADGTGSTADLAALTGWPVVLVLDVKSQAQSAAALVHGFATYPEGCDDLGRDPEPSRQSQPRSPAPHRPGPPQHPRAGCSAAPGCPSPARPPSGSGTRRRA